MFIVWGTKILRSTAGRRADYCLLCRGFQPHRVIRVKSVGHLYYVPLGFGKLVGFEHVCESCSLKRYHEPDEFDPLTSSDRHADVEALIADTNPDARREWASRLAIDDRIRSDKLLPGERSVLLDESFTLANVLLVHRTAAIRFDSLSSLGMLATIGVPFAVAAVVPMLPKTGADPVGMAVVAGFVCAMLTIILLANDGRRYTRRTILPVLIRAIRPLRPTEEEIDGVLESLYARKDKLGKVLKTHQVVDALTFPVD